MNYVKSKNRENQGKSGTLNKGTKRDSRTFLPVVVGTADVRRKDIKKGLPPRRTEGRGGATLRARRRGTRSRSAGRERHGWRRREEGRAEKGGADGRGRLRIFRD